MLLRMTERHQQRLPTDRLLTTSCLSHAYVMHHISNIISCFSED